MSLAKYIKEEKCSLRSCNFRSVDRATVNGHCFAHMSPSFRSQLGGSSILEKSQASLLALHGCRNLWLYVKVRITNVGFSILEIFQEQETLIPRRYYFVLP